MLVRVLKIPKTDGGFRFSSGLPQTFVEVDWFRDDHFPITPESEADYRDFISSKSYFEEGTPFLVLHPTHSFTIGYEAE